MPCCKENGRYRLLVILFIKLNFIRKLNITICGFRRVWGNREAILFLSGGEYCNFNCNIKKTSVHHITY